MVFEQNVELQSSLTNMVDTGDNVYWSRRTARLFTYFISTVSIIVQFYTNPELQGMKKFYIFLLIDLLKLLSSSFLINSVPQLVIMT